MKARVTVTFEYDLSPDSYPGTDDPRIMVIRDLESFVENPELLAEVMMENKFQIAGSALPRTIPNG